MGKKRDLPKIEDNWRNSNNSMKYGYEERTEKLSERIMD
jgi:hypothetical protein